GEIKEGDQFTVEIFKDVEKVDITGTSKGKGFQGVMKRHGYSGGPASHGSKFHRAPGSVGSTTFPGRVLKGKGMPGHMGNERKTIIGLKVVKIIPEKGLMFVKGAVPGPSGGYVLVKKSKRSAK
ncbi:MAG: 50S ribosomal protein L3, partial [Candidatus Aminicenantes bacterium]|nr:50S ribosomal protein L3 [Candidatus Aminicenantes bacterium]